MNRVYLDYNATTALTLNGGTISYSGFVNGDSATSLTTPAQLHTLATLASPVGSYPITQGTLAAGNYTISFTSGVTFAITPMFFRTSSASLNLSLNGRERTRFLCCESGIRSLLTLISGV